MWTIKIKTLSGGLTLQLVVVVPWCADDGDGDGDGFVMVLVMMIVCADDGSFFSTSPI